jgi:ERF superfamily protein
MENGQIPIALMSPEISEIADALCKAQGMFKPVIKNRTAKVFPKNGAAPYSYQYADFPAILEATKEGLVQNGLCITQPFAAVGKVIVLNTYLIHKSGQWFRSILEILTEGLQIQSVGSLMTYNRKYAYSAMIGICHEEDDDAVEVNEKQKQIKQKYINKTVPKELENHEELPPDDFMPPEETINFKEAEGIELLIHPDDVEFRQNLLAHGAKLMGRSEPLPNFTHLAKKHYAACLQAVNNKVKERIKKGLTK